MIDTCILLCDYTCYIILDVLSIAMSHVYLTLPIFHRHTMHVHGYSAFQILSVSCILSRHTVIIKVQHCSMITPRTPYLHVHVHHDNILLLLLLSTCITATCYLNTLIWLWNHSTPYHITYILYIIDIEI